ncbi:MAG TPA: glycosyltransferase family 1 protein, partial [Acidimicrobiia bacterium]|nr:glycosyltransferase family 1 protein [Acidimicrobiia bacterium]
MTDAAPAPHLFVDLQVTQSTAYGERGMPRYAGELAAALYEDGAPIAGFGLNPRLPPPARLPKSVTTSGLLVWNTIAEFRRLAASGPLTTLLTCPFFEEHPIESVLPRHMLLGSAALAAVVYDLIPYAMPQRYQQTVAEQRLYGLRHELVRRADVLLALSEHTRRDVIDRFGVEDDKVVVIGAGASEFFRPPVDARDATHEVQTALPDVTQPFVLGVGGADPRKNWAALVRGFAALPATLRDELQLVVVSNPVIRDTLRTLLEETGLPAGRVVLASNVSDALLRALYQSAALFVLPSVYEGFGLPALEAVRCGCPAITSNATALPEVLQFPPATFPPLDVEALSGLMRRALEDEPFRSELVEAGRRAAAEHTWPRVAGRSLRALEGIRVGPSARPIPRRVAILGVGTTDGDSVAGLPIGVLDAVADRVDLDCF